jgi:hypothetical protein
MRIGALVSTVTAVCLVFFEGSGDKANEKDSPAVNAARLRQEAVKTVEIRFRRTDEYALRPTASPSAKALYADADLSPVESDNRLVLSGDMFRYEDNHPDRRMPSGQVHPKSWILVYDGSISKTLYPNGLGGQGEPQGFIDSKNSWEEFLHVLLSPIYLTFCGLDPGRCPNLVSEWQATGATTKIDGGVCQEFSPPLQGNVHESFWLAPDQDYVVRRRRVVSKTGFDRQTDIHYRRHEARGWVPYCWVVSGFSGTPTYAITTKIDVLELRFNDTHSADEFQIDFPVGCSVFDQDAKRFYRVRPDKSLGEFEPRAQAQPRSMNLPMDSLFERNKWFVVSWGLGSLAVILLASVLLFVLRRKRGNAMKHNSPGPHHA